MVHQRLVGFMLIIALAAVPGLARQNDPSLLTLERLFSSQEFTAETFGQARWIDDGAGYTKLEKSTAANSKRDIVRYETATGKRSILVGADRLIPAGQTAQLDIEDYSWSADGQKLLIFTNTQKVWRENTRGDYWVLDLKTRKAVASSAATRSRPRSCSRSSRPTASASPTCARTTSTSRTSRADASRGSRMTARARSSTARSTGSTRKSSVCATGFAGAPTASRIAYWQLDASGVRDF